MLRSFLMMPGLLLATTAVSSAGNSSYYNFLPKARTDAFVILPADQSPNAVLVEIMTGDKVDICSGTLVTPEWVLTAAHCVGERLTVYAGGMNYQELYTGNLHPGAQVLQGIEAHPHPKYREGRGMGHDIALIKVAGFEMTHTVNTVPFAIQPFPKRSQTCKLVGFGRVQLERENKEDFWRKTQTLYGEKRCPCEKYLKRALGAGVYRSWLCARPQQDYGLCSGDSGSGLLCGGVAVAVASVIVQTRNLAHCRFRAGHSDCGSRNTLSAFVDVCCHARWLQTHVTSVNVSLISPECKDPGSCGRPAPSFVLVSLLLIKVTIFL